MRPSPICQCPTPIGPTIAEICGGTQLFAFLALLSHFLRSQCSQPCSSQPPPPIIQAAATEYDFIVVGAGASGCVVASRLAEVATNRVLLIEAGGQQPADLQVPGFEIPYQRFAANWGYRTEPNWRAFRGQPGGRAGWPRGKMLGGSSALNGMIYLRGNREDYDGWRQLGNDGWGYSDVLPYFLKSESHRTIGQVDGAYHGRRGPMRITTTGPQQWSKLTADLLAASAGAGLAVQDLNAANATGVMASNLFIHKGERQSAATAFLRPPRVGRNLHILLDTLVARVQLEPGTNRAVAVQVLSQLHPNSPAISIAAAKEIIICAGVEQSPKILMLSGIGGRRQLRRWRIAQLVNSPGVGANLQNHVAMPFRVESLAHPSFPLNWAIAAEYLLHRSGSLALQGTALDAKYASRFARQPTVPDVQLQFSDSFLSPENVCVTSAEVRRRPLLVWSGPIVLQPRSVGSIRLRSADPRDLPRICGNELSRPEDVEVLLDGIRKILAIYESPVLTHYNLTIRREGSAAEGKPCAGLETGSDGYWRCLIRHDSLPFYHPVGTCRMGPVTDGRAVVDSELRVHGVERLRVADASVMPTIVAANTCATTLMIGEKAADLVKAAWGQLPLGDEVAGNWFHAYRGKM